MSCQCRGQFQGALWRRRRNELDAVCYAAPPAIKRRGSMIRVFAEQVEFDVIVICQDDIGKSGGDVARRKKFLLGRWKSHRRAGIDKDVGEEIDFFAEELYVQPVAARIDTPIKVAKIIPGCVSPVIGKFQTGASSR